MHARVRAPPGWVQAAPACNIVTCIASGDLCNAPRARWHVSLMFRLKQQQRQHMRVHVCSTSRNLGSGTCLQRAMRRTRPRQQQQVHLLLGRRQHAAADGNRSAAGRSSSAGRGRGKAGRGAPWPPTADTDTQQVDYSSTAALPTPLGSGHKRTQSVPPSTASNKRGDMHAAAGSRASSTASMLSGGGRGRGKEAGLRR